jgi:hypothetical protein
MLLVIFVVGFFAAVITVFVRRWLLRVAVEEEYERLRSLLKDWRSLLGLKSSLK